MSKSLQNCYWINTVSFVGRWNCHISKKERLKNLLNALWVILTTLSSLRAFTVAMETLFSNPRAFRVFHNSSGLPLFSVGFVSKLILFFFFFFFFGEFFFLFVFLSISFTRCYFVNDWGEFLNEVWIGFIYIKALIIKKFQFFQGFLICYNIVIL